MPLISHTPASEVAFENGNRKFLIRKIIDFSDKKSLIFDFDLAKKMAFFAHLEYI